MNLVVLFQLTDALNKTLGGKFLIVDVTFK